MTDFLQDMLAHAEASYPNEACGLVVAAGKKHRLIRARNLSEEPRTSFIIDTDAFLEVGDGEDVIGVYHSHSDTSPEPSLADRTHCEASGLPWHIVSWPSAGYAFLEPSGFRAPYLERPYVYGIHDCYSIGRDWYMWEWGLDLPNFAREPEWWNKGQNLFLENFEACGFVQLIDQDAQVGDAFLIQVRSNVPNHMAIYLGEGMILHHCQGRLSTKDPWGGYWAKHCTHHLRHNSKIGERHG